MVSLILCVARFCRRPKRWVLHSKSVWCIDDMCGFMLVAILKNLRFFIFYFLFFVHVALVRFLRHRSRCLSHYSFFVHKHEIKKRTRAALQTFNFVWFIHESYLIVLFFEFFFLTFFHSISSSIRFYSSRSLLLEPPSELNTNWKGNLKIMHSFFFGFGNVSFLFRKNKNKKTSAMVPTQW